MTLSLKLALYSTVAVCSLGATHCNNAQRARAANAESGSVVSSFELTGNDLPVEVAFLRALDFDVAPERELLAPSFGELLGLPNARAHAVTLSLGKQQLEVRKFSFPEGHTGQPAYANALAFEHIAIVVRDIAAADASVRQAGAQVVSLAPQSLPASNPVAGGVRAEYFRDPLGHFMELLQFPPDKGDRVWHVPTQRLFLGIDHSGIAVSSTSESLRFYRDLLGLSVKTQSLNEGPEQDALSGVPGARVHITSLRGERGPGVELLEYIAPLDGRPFPPSTPADSVHWEIVIWVNQLELTLNALRQAGFRAPEHGSNVSGVLPGEREAALVRDPDGHTVRIFEGAH